MRWWQWVRPHLALVVAFTVTRILPSVIIAWLVYVFAVLAKLDTAAPVVGTLCGVWMFADLLKGGGR